ncbi:MAG: DNA-binding response regulator [Segetibacter sp.]|jgi:NarL family two-component system response regulator LiaR|nr:DNA-binding response regulator [Segetibacter sp.]
MMVKFLTRNKHTILYGVSLALLLFLLKWLELRFIIIDHAFEVYIGAIAIIFTALGIWLALKLIKPKIQTVVVEKEVYINTVVEKEAPINDHPAFMLNEKELDELGLSKRELEVLQLMASGLSNQEIAARLYVSLNTVKTHTSRVFEKLDVKRRTQAIEKAKRLSLIP